MEMGVYNKAVYWPIELEIKIQKIKSKPQRLIPTSHYKEKEAKLKLPNNCYKAALYGQIVEAEYNGTSVTKIITRLTNRYNHSQDICYAIAIGNDGLHIKTVWTNNKEDNHYTLKANNYIQKGAITNEKN